MGNLEHFSDWHDAVTTSSEEKIATATRTLLERMHDNAASMSWPGEQRLEALPVNALNHSHWSFTTRRVDRARVKSLLEGNLQPQVGDLLLARIETLGHHGKLQLVDGRRRRLFRGDLVIVTYANRYACEQFEAEVPQSLASCHLVAGGGIAALALSWHDRIVKGPTTIQPLGLLADDQGRRINVGDFSLPALTALPAIPPLFAVVGTAMDAGKTETAAHLVRGLKSTGRRTGYIKITGTGAGGDTWLLQDAGADCVLDFTDAGLPSTYRAPVARIEHAMELLVGHMASAGVDAIVMEVADGVYQQETAQLVRSATFARRVSGIVLAARDAMGASAGIRALDEQPRPVLALSGLLSASPLQRREAQVALGIDSFSREDLASAAVARRLLAGAAGSGQREMAQ